jgi:hypothetical protein
MASIPAELAFGMTPGKWLYMVVKELIANFQGQAAPASSGFVVF